MPRLQRDARREVLQFAIENIGRDRDTDTRCGLIAPQAINSAVEPFLAPAFPVVLFAGGELP